MVALEDSTGVTEFGWDADHMVEAHDSKGVKWRAVWGSGVNELLAFDGQITRYIPVQDVRNSIVALWSVGGEELVDIHSYDAHGRLETALQYEEQIVCSEIFDPQGGADGPPCIPLESSIPFAFNGAWRSPTTGIYYMRNRWYAPQLFQFLTPDPEEFIDSTNVYAFAAFDPINYWDPYGLDSSFMKGWERAGLDMLKETANLVAEGVRRGPSGGGVVGAAGDRLATGVRSAYREGGWSAVDDMLNPFTNFARSMDDLNNALNDGTNADVGEAAANSMLSFAAVLGTMGGAARANRPGKNPDVPDGDAQISSRYHQRVDGNPEAIHRGFGKPSKRQQALLNNLPEHGSEVIVRKSEVGLNDLAAMTAATGDEFAMFTTGGRRLIIRGDATTVPVDVDRAAQMAQQGWRFSAHTHPEVGNIRSSPGDRNVLRAFEENGRNGVSSILEPTGDRGRFTPKGDSVADWTP